MNEVPTPLDVGDAPPLGTLVVHRDVEAVFVANNLSMQGCSSCTYSRFCGGAPGQNHLHCPGGVYLDKQTYLEMKLLGELV